MEAGARMADWGMKMKAIGELSFGFNDAREYLQPESRPLLERFFLADDNLAALAQPQRCFLIGEKGTGKTAYAAYLSTCDYQNLRGHTAFIQDTDYLLLRSQGQDQSLRPEDFVPNWELVLLMLAFLRITEKSGSFSISDQSPFEAAERVVDALDLSKDAPVSDLFELLRNATEALTLVNDAVRQDSSARTYSTSGDYRRSIKSLRQFFLSAVKSVRPDRNNIIFVDGIDVRPSVVPFEEYMAIVKALVNATWVLNSERLNSLPERYVRFVALIPQARTVPHCPEGKAQWNPAYPATCASLLTGMRAGDV